MEKLKEEVEKGIDSIVEQGIKSENIEALYQLVDIHKDLANEEYWKNKEEVMKMRYRGYGEYGNEYGRESYNEGGSYGRRQRDSRGRYMEGSYGRRGVPGTGRGRYRGEEMMDEMAYHYGNYSEGMQSYGADQETMKSFKYMLKAFKDYYKHLKQEASSQEEVKMLEDTAREISQM